MQINFAKKCNLETCLKRNNEMLKRILLVPSYTACIERIPFKKHSRNNRINSFVINRYNKLTYNSSKSLLPNKEQVL